ncbi:MAG: hypothetical protein MUF31_17975 [Akkermansiaceae bacterium]|nr:hypothetical protein [Akkermansiaceae bacterium]
MPRLIRIALTFFASATILVLLTRQRAVNLRSQLDAGLADELARDESRMIVLGTVLSGALGLGGLILLALAFFQSRRKP